MNIGCKKLMEILGTDSEKMYIKEVMSIPLLTVQEEQKLVKMAHDGDLEAREKIIKSNLRLVVSIVNKHLNKGFSFLDLVGEGNLGLFKALEKYDYNKGVKFGTYATYWIKSYIYRYIADNDKCVRIPFTQYYKILAYRKAFGSLTLRLNRVPTIREIMDELHISKEDMLDISNTEIFSNVINIDELIVDKDNKGLVNDDYHESLEEEFINSELRDYIDKVLSSSNLSDYEKDILRLKYGFVNDKVYSYVEIGKMYNVTRQRIHEVHERALKKIRLSDSIIDFIDYADRPDETLRYLNAYRDKYYHHVLKKGNR